MRKLFVLIFVAGMLSLLPAAQMLESGQQVTATGLGAILNGDEAKAREDAVSAALRNAVEQVVGTMIESNVLVENYMTVEDQIYSHTRGYVQKYDIISTQKQSDNSLQVSVRAVVKISDLRDDLEAIGVLISRKGKPRLMVLIDERNINQEFNQLNMDMGTAATAIMNEMMAAGFPFVDARQAQSAISRDQVAAALSGDTQAAAAVANRLGAEIIITGSAVSKAASGGPQVVRDAGFKSCQANINLRVIRADDGVIIATAMANDRAAHIDEITGGTMALEKAGKKAAAELQTKIVDAWQKDVYSGSQVQLAVMKVANFSQLNILKNNMKYYIRGVQAVNQREFSAGTALFDVDIKGNAELLASELEAKEIEGIRLRVTGLTANKVTAEIIQ